MKLCKRNILDLTFYLCWTFLAPCPDFSTNFDNLLRAQQFDNLKRKKKTDVIWSLTAAGKGCIHLVSHWVSLSDTLMYPMILSSLVLCRMISIQFACALLYFDSYFFASATYIHNWQLSGFSQTYLCRSCLYLYFSLISLSLFFFSNSQSESYVLSWLWHLLWSFFIFGTITIKGFSQLRLQQLR